MATVLERMMLSLRRRRADPVVARGKSGPHPLPPSLSSMYELEHSPAESDSQRPVQGRLIQCRRLERTFDRALLDAALARVIQRHEALRFRVERDATGLRFVDDAPPISPEWLEGGAVLDGAAADATALAFISRPFPARGPLWRLGVFLLGENDTVLVTAMDHVIGDGWSSGVLLKELIAAHDALKDGAEPEWTEAPHQFSDFLAWESEFVRSAEHQRLLEHWTARLRSMRPLVPLTPGTGTPGARAQLRIDLEPAIADAVRALAKREDVTVFMVLLSAFFAALARASNATDLSLGNHVANRRPGTEDLIGYLSNAVVLRVDAGGDPSLRELLRRTREVVLDASDAADLRFPTLVGALPRIRAYQWPLYCLSFDHLRTREDEKVFLSPWSNQLHPFAVFGVESQDRLGLVFDHDPRFLSRDDVSSFAALYLQIVSALVSHGDAALSSLPALPAPLFAASKDASASGQPRVPPATPTEQRLVELWKALLQRPELGVEDDFFALGGNSLLAVRLISKVNDDFKTTLPLAALFETLTVRGLASHVDRAGRTAGEGTARRSALKVTATPGSRQLPSVPTSFTEERHFRWWQQADEQVAGRVMREAFVLEGKLDTDALSRAVAQLQRRHDLLRSVYVDEGKTVTRRVLKDSAPPLRLVDCRRAADPEAEALAAMNAEILKPFALTEAPPLRLGVFRISENKQLLSFAADHIAADAEGIRLLLSELKALYAAYANGEQARLEEPSLQYADFALWQRDVFSDSRVVDPERAFWAERLDGQEPLTRKLPADKDRAAVDAIRAERYLEGMPVGRMGWPGRPELGKALDAAARENKSTLFAATFAAFAVALGRHAGAPEVVASTLNDYRRRVVGLDGVLGSFNNPTLLRLRTDGAPTWGELIRRAQRDLNAVSAHVELPLIPLLYPRLNDLFRVVFNFVPSSTQAPVDWPGAVARAVPRSQLPAANKTHLDLLFAVRGDALEGSIDWNDNLWSRPTAQRWVDDFFDVAGRMAAAPNDPAH